jgi:hypothetical protein
MNCEVIVCFLSATNAHTHTHRTSFCVYSDVSIALSLWDEDWYTVGYYFQFCGFRRIDLLGCYSCFVNELCLVSMATCVNTKHCPGLRSVPYSWRVSEVNSAHLFRFLVYCEASRKVHNITCYISCCLTQRCAIPGYQFALATKFCEMAPNNVFVGRQ